MSNIFFNEYGGLRIWLIMLLTTTGYVSVFFAILVMINAYHNWQCSNFQEVTGRHTKYVDFDACFVENQQGEMIRYDKAYKK